MFLLFLVLYKDKKFQVAERALFFWNNDRIINMVSQNRQVILPLVVPAIERNSKSHWNQSVLNLTLNARRMLLEMDEELYTACQMRFEEEEENRTAMEERRRVTWDQLEAAAAFKKPVTGNTAVLVGAIPPLSPVATLIT